MLFFFFFQFFWFIFLPGVFKSLCVVSQYLRYLQVNYYEKNSLPIWSFISSFMNCLPWLWVSEATQSCPTLCGPVDCNPPGSSIHVILQARILEWLAISFARDLPNPGIEPRSPALQADSLLTELQGKPSTQDKYPRETHIQVISSPPGPNLTFLALYWMKKWVNR